MATLARLADDLAVLLERRGKGARRLELTLFRVDGGVAAHRASAPAGRSTRRGAMARLFAERLAGARGGGDRRRLRNRPDASLLPCRRTARAVAERHGSALEDGERAARSPISSTA